MSISPSDILILCCHIKRSLFFEDSIKRLWNKGYKRVWIQETGRSSYGIYQGPHEKYFSAKHFPATWDRCLINFHNRTNNEDYKYIFLVDYDLFFIGTDEFTKCINELAKDEYDHVSRFKVRENQSKYDFGNKQIALVPEIQVLPGNTDHDWPQLEPHFATGFEFFSKRLWNSYTNYELGDGRRMYRAAIERNMKMGVHRTNYGPGEMCWGKDWFHISNLTYYYQQVESGDFKDIDGKQQHLFRIGFFAAQEEYYGSEIYSPIIRKNLDLIYQKLGGKNICLDAWYKGIEKTPMVAWRKYD